MRNYIILNNQNSNTISGLIIQELPAISKPAQRTQIETIDGRDGDIVTPLGYAAYDKTFTIGLYGNFDINEVIAYFATKGTVIFSNEPDKYYYYQIVDQIDYERLVRYRVATVTMHVQPFKYSATEGTITVDASDTVSGEGSNIALDGTAEAPFNILRHKGNATQTTYTGKNVLNTNALNRTLPFTSTSRGVAFTVDSDGSITINGKNDGTGNSLISIYTRDQIPLTLTAGQYTGDLNPVDGVYRAVNMMSYDGASYKSFRQNSTQTLTANNHSIYIQVVNGEQTTFTNYKIYPMLEVGATKSPYEPYVGNLPSPSPDYPQDIQVLTGDSTVKIMGKNLCSNVSLPDANDIRFYIAGITSNTITLSSIINVATVSNSIYLSVDGVGMGRIGTISGGAGARQTATLTLTDEQVEAIKNGGVSYLQLYKPNAGFTLPTESMLEESAQATAYEPYQEQSYEINLGSIELAKIGDYADEPVKVDGTWYIRRAIKKVVYDGSESWSVYNSGSPSYFYYTSVPATPNLTNYDLMSNMGVRTSIGTTGTNQGLALISGNAVRARLGEEKALADWKTWLEAHNLILYYQLATPTDEEITDQDLIDALDELYDQAHAYKVHTHITATAADGNAPAVLAVDVNEDNESTVTNAGNTTSRPILTVYGQGDIGVYINDVEVLDIALGDEEYITLDSVEMEAYKDTTANLKNRLVTGDYSKLALNAGANKIRFTGKVTKYEISKYSRWL